MLDNFSARQQSCKTVLNWHSVTELNLKNYEIEYGTDGRSFTVIGTMNGTGDNGRYSFTHQPRNGRAYYRLRMVDNNGASKYSDIIAINSNCNGKSMLVYPNPASTVLNVNLSGFTGTVTGKLFSSTGQLIVSRNLLNGTNNIAVDKLSAGTYALVVSDAAGEQQVYRVQVTH